MLTTYLDMIDHHQTRNWVGLSSIIPERALLPQDVLQHQGLKDKERGQLSSFQPRLCYISFSNPMAENVVTIRALAF